MQIYKTRLESADQEIEALKAAMSSAEEKNKLAMQSKIDDLNSQFHQALDNEKGKLKHIVDEVQNYVERNLALILSKLQAKEQQLQSLEHKLRLRFIEFKTTAEVHSAEQLQREVHNLKSFHLKEVEKMKTEVNRYKQYQTELEELRVLHTQEVLNLNSELSRLKNCENELSL